MVNTKTVIVNNQNSTKGTCLVCGTVIYYTPRIVENMEDQK